MDYMGVMRLPLAHAVHSSLIPLAQHTVINFLSTLSPRLHYTHRAQSDRGCKRGWNVNGSGVVKGCHQCIKSISFMGFSASVLSGSGRRMSTSVPLRPFTFSRK